MPSTVCYRSADVIFFSFEIKCPVFHFPDLEGATSNLI